MPQLKAPRAAPKTWDCQIQKKERCFKIFLKREFCKDQNKWNSKGAMSGKYGGWIRTSYQAVTVFAWSSEKHAVLGFPDGKLCVFCWLILGAFIQCSVIWLGAVLVGINHLVFQKELIRQDSFHSYHIPNIAFRSWWLGGEEPTCQCGRHRHSPWARKIPWSKKGPLLEDSLQATWTCWISHRTFPYTAQIFCVCFSYIFTFLEIIEHNMRKM